MRRALPIVGALCLACTCNPPPVDPEVEVEAQAPVVPPAAKVTCPQVYPGGEITPRPPAKWDREAFEATAKALEMTADCADKADEGAYSARRCEWSGERWGFSVAALEFLREEDAVYAVEDPYPGEFFARDGVHVLHIEARNGVCGNELLEAVIGRVPPETYTSSLALSNAVSASGWTPEECSLDLFDSQTSLKCAAVYGADLSVEMELEWAGPSAGTEGKKETDDGIGWWWYDTGEALAVVHDGRAARALGSLMAE